MGRLRRVEHAREDAASFLLFIRVSPYQGRPAVFPGAHRAWHGAAQTGPSAGSEAPQSCRGCGETPLNGANEG